MMRIFSQSKFSYNQLFELLDFYKIERNPYLFFYSYFFSLLYKILETVYTPYINNKKKPFVAPNSKLIRQYSIVMNYFYLIRETPRIHGIPKFEEIKLFYPLNGDYDRILTDWTRSRGKFIDHIAFVDDFNILNKVPKYQIPTQLSKLVSNLEKAMLEQLMIQRSGGKQVDRETFILPDEFKRDSKDKRIFYFGENKLSFTNKTSTKLTIFTFIFNKRGDWINLIDIGKHIKKDNHYIRQVIVDLRKDLKGIEYTIQLSGGTTSKARLISINLATKIT